MLGGAFPAKVKAIRILHLNRVIRLALAIAMPLLSAKMRARQVELAVLIEYALNSLYVMHAAERSSARLEGIKS